MNFEFKKSFARDLKKKAQGIKLRSRVKEIIHEVDNAESLYEIKNIKKLKDFKPETWRYRIGSWRFFYEINEQERIVFMLAASHRSSAY